MGCLLPRRDSRQEGHKNTTENSVMYVNDLWFGNITEDGYAAMNENAYTAE